MNAFVINWLTYSLFVHCYVAHWFLTFAALAGALNCLHRAYYTVVINHLTIPKSTVESINKHLPSSIETAEWPDRQCLLL